MWHPKLELGVAWSGGSLALSPTWTMWNKFPTGKRLPLLEDTVKGKCTCSENCIHLPQSTMVKDMTYLQCLKKATLLFNPYHKYAHMCAHTYTTHVAFSLVFLSLTQQTWSFLSVPEARYLDPSWSPNCGHSLVCQHRFLSILQLPIYGPTRTDVQGAFTFIWILLWLSPTIK